MRWLMPWDGRIAPAEVVRALDAAGVKVTNIAVRGASLDDVFLLQTGRSLRDATEKVEV